MRGNSERHGNGWGILNDITLKIVLIRVIGTFLLHMEKGYIRRVKVKQESYARATPHVVCCVSDHVIMFLWSKPCWYAKVEHLETLSDNKYTAGAPTTQHDWQHSREEHASTVDFCFCIQLQGWQGEEQTNSHICKNNKQQKCAKWFRTDVHVFSHTALKTWVIECRAVWLVTSSAAVGWTFVVLSLTNDKTGWGTNAALELIRLIAYNVFPVHYDFLGTIFTLCFCTTAFASYHSPSHSAAHIMTINHLRIEGGTQNHGTLHTSSTLERPRGIVSYRRSCRMDPWYATREVQTFNDSWAKHVSCFCCTRPTHNEYDQVWQKHATFSIRHGKDVADSKGSIIVRWLREKETTLSGLKPDLDDIVRYLRTCIKDHIATGRDADIVILPWKPNSTRPSHSYRLTMGNMRKSNSKMMKRGADGKIIQYVCNQW